MNLSLKNRIAISFIIANLVVLILSFTVFHFLNGLNKEVEKISEQSNKISILTDEIRISAVSILKYQHRILVNKGKDTSDLVEKIINLCEGLTSQLHTLDSYLQDTAAKKIITRMLSYVDSLKLVLSKASLFVRDSGDNSVGMSSVEELADKILDAFAEFQDFQYLQGAESDKKVKKIINENSFKNNFVSFCFFRHFNDSDSGLQKRIRTAEPGR
ncbi:MAG: hypothetical protein WCG27_13550, partial [Pseudomonadota bacterium]